MSSQIEGAESKDTGTPFILKLIMKCQKYKIEYATMKQLNFSDLLALVIECDIRSYKEYIDSKEKKRLADNGVEVREAKSQDFKNLFGGG